METDVLAKTSVTQLTTSPHHQARTETLQLLTLLLLLGVPETAIHQNSVSPRTD